MSLDLGYNVTAVLQRAGDAYNRVCRIVLKNELKNQSAIIEWDQYVLLKASVEIIDKRLMDIEIYANYVQEVEEAASDDKNFFM